MTTATAAPERTEDQRLEALKLANAVRSNRAVTKRAVKHGEVSFEVLLEHPPEHMMSMKIIDYLICIPRVGRVTAFKVLRITKTAPSRTLAGLSQRQRGAIATALERRCIR